ncbi:MAG: serine/threonine protein kinase [Planctomycetes bacterium]|nr:serine/threonine protein kinase [Planctomycetota bacterium]
MTLQNDDPPTELEETLARELEPRISSAESGAARPELAPPIEALAKLREALAPIANFKIPEVPGFHIRGELGRGGMGIVMRAYDAALEREVAIKFLSPEFAEDNKSRERFLREARALAKVRHPNLVAVHTAGEIDGRPFFVMEMVEGTSLDRAIAKARRGEGGVLPVEARARSKVVSRIFIETAEALAAVHRAGLLHRDVKPANILISTDGSARLADFGISIDRRAAADGGGSGTLRYLSPERVSNALGEEDARGDVYALGLSMIEALTLHPPFLQKTPAELRTAILAGPGPTAPPPGVDAKLLEVAVRASARNAADRFPDAAEFARALRELANRNRLFTKYILIAGAAAALVAAGFGIAALTGAFRGAPPDPLNARPPGDFNNINNRRQRNAREFGPPPGPNGERGGPQGEWDPPGIGGLPAELQEELRINFPVIPRLRQFSAEKDWDAFHHEANRILEHPNNNVSGKILRAWIYALQEKPEPEKARAIVNEIPPPADGNIGNPIERQRHEILDFLDGRAGPIRPPFPREGR